jgi:hypothetical protein
MDPNDGSVRWTNISSGGTLQSSPALAGGLVAFCDREGLKVIRTVDGVQEVAYKFGDASDSSPAVADDKVIWGDNLGYVRAVGPKEEIDVDGSGGDDPMMVLLISLAILDLVFLAVVLIVLRLLRKKYNKNRRLRMEQEFSGGR